MPRLAVPATIAADRWIAGRWFAGSWIGGSIVEKQEKLMEAWVATRAGPLGDWGGFGGLGGLEIGGD